MLMQQLPTVPIERNKSLECHVRLSNIPKQRAK